MEYLLLIIPSATKSLRRTIGTGSINTPVCELASSNTIQ